MAHAMTVNYDAGANVGGLFARLREAFAAYRVYLETRNELEALSDRELADLGISRLNIRDIARQAATAA